MNRRNVLQAAAVAPVAALLPAVPVVATETIVVVAFSDPEWKIDARIVDAKKGIIEVDLTLLPQTRTVIEISYTVQP